MSLSEINGFPLGPFQITGFLLTFGAVVFLQKLLNWPSQKLPLVNNTGPFDFLRTKAVRQFQLHARELIKSGFELHQNAFYILTDTGREIFLSPQYAEEIRNDRRLNTFSFAEKTSHANIPGFEVSKCDPVQDRIFTVAVKTKLTPSFGKLIGPLALEVSAAIHERWSNNPEWRELVLGETVEMIFAQSASTVFVGSTLARDPAWLRLAVSFTSDLGRAINVLSTWPVTLRSLAAHFLPECRRLRQTMKNAREMITLEIERREAQELLTGEKPADFFQWVNETASGEPYDPVIMQLRITFASIHTSSDHLVKVLFQLCEHPELVADLRSEIVTVHSAHGWSKKGLHHLKLMDSVLKEVQRLNPATVAVGRLVEESVTLRDGLRIPQGTIVRISGHTMRDHAIYPHPDQFDGYRYYKLRQIPGRENASQFVSTSPEHIGFGHGIHACPGRFFASAVMKIVLCHILLKYDLMLVPESTPRISEFGTGIHANLHAKVAVKRRQEEITI